MRWACIHDKADVAGAPPPCGKVAFYCLVKPYAGMLLSPELFLMLDGRHPEAGEITICGSCGEYIDMKFASEVLTVIEEN